MANILRKSGQLALTVIALAGLSGCVTQNYADDEPVVEKDFSDDQLAKTRISLALGYLDMGNTAQAKYNLEKARQFSPNLVYVYTAFAHYYERVGEIEQAEEAYIKALSIEEEDADTLNNFGVFLCRQNRIEEAEVQFKKAIRVPTYIRTSESYENIALCYLKIDGFDKAEDGLRRAILHSPNSPSSLFQMAQIQYAKGDYNEAANMLSRFELATRRFTSQAIALSYKVQKKLGNEEIANNYATMLLNMFPNSSESKQYLDNELAHVSADELAIKYKKFKLLKTGAKVNQEPIVVAKKGTNAQLPKDGLNQRKPAISFDNKKLVDDATIAKQTSQSINNNSMIAAQSNPTATTNATTNATTTPANVSVQPQSKPVNVAVQNKPAPTKSAPITKPVNKAPVKPAPQPAAPTKIKIASLNNPVHIVQKGENLFQISMKYNITIATLRRWNKLTNENIKVGQALRLTKPD